jgi:hypothetical protein
VIFFDALPAAAPEAELPPVQFAIDKFEIHGHARRQSRNPSDQRLAVRFSRRKESEHCL